eukprot:gene11748-13708_t
MRIRQKIHALHYVLVYAVWCISAIVQTGLFKAILPSGSRLSFANAKFSLFLCTDLTSVFRPAHHKI